MEIGLLWLLVAAAAGFLMAMANGANDVANSFASAVGAKAITIQQATLIAGLMNFLGATILGGYVAANLVTGLIDPTRFDQPREYAVAMFAVLAASACFVLASTYFKLPVSSSHAIVGSMVGVSAWVGGIDTVDRAILAGIVLSWFVSPVLAGVMAMVLLRLIRRVITRDGKDGMMERLRFYLPYFLGVAACVFALILMKKGALSEFRPETVAGYLAFAAVVIPYGALLSQGLLRSSTITMEDNEESVESVFRRLQVGTSCYVAFAHGANDVANSISPVFGIYLAYRSGLLPDDGMVAATGVPLWVLVLGGLGIATGTGLLGSRVIETLGERVTTLNNTRGFCVDFSAASTIVAASIAGLPVSSTHAATGAILGSGVGDRIHVDWRLFRRIIVAWVVTVPIAALWAIVMYLVIGLFVS